MPTPLKDYIFVGLQLILFIAYLVPVQLNILELPEWLRYSGLVIFGLGMVLGLVALLQINTKLSPFPTPVSKGKLITSGAYRLSRHPIYTALIFSGLGYGLYQPALFKLLITLLLLILFYFKSQYEEQLLSEKFPGYTAYKKDTRRFM